MKFDRRAYTNWIKKFLVQIHGIVYVNHHTLKVVSKIMIKTRGGSKRGEEVEIIGQIPLPLLYLYW